MNVTEITDVLTLAITTSVRTRAVARMDIAKMATDVMISTNVLQIMVAANKYVRTTLVLSNAAATSATTWMVQVAPTSTNALVTTDATRIA